MNQKFLTRTVENGIASKVYRILLVIWDVICINGCSFLALFMRYDMNWDKFINSHTVRAGEYVQTLTDIMVVNTILTLIIFMVFHLYSSMWRFAGMSEVLNIALATGISGVMHLVLIKGVLNRPMPRTYFVIYVLLLFIVTVVIRFSYRLCRQLYKANSHGSHMRNTLIIGAGEAGNMVINELKLSVNLDSHICGIIDDEKAKQGTYIQGIRVLGGRDQILPAVQKYKVNEIIVAMPSVSKKKVKNILEICQKTNAELKIVPGMYQFVNGEAQVEKIRPVQIEDLLGREPVRIDLDAVINYVKNKVVLVTGGGGSIGSELCRQVAANHPKMLIIFDIYENNAYAIQNELKRKHPELHLTVLIGSVRDEKRLHSVFEKHKPQVVFHAAAHKHVPLMEDSPLEAIKNNVFGTWNTARTAGEFGAERFVLISTDKAVNPTNVMGATKRICEMIVQNCNKEYKTEFVAVRFGNVLGSNGSVVPLFKEQIAAGGPVTVTHPDIIRYFMTIPEAVSLVLQAGALAKGGEIFVLDMGKPVRILDMAEKLIRLSGYEPYVDIKIQFSGLRPGEKLYEELLMDEEGLSGTENALIHIGRPIAIQEDFFERLENLRQTLSKEDGVDVRAEIKVLVPTYHPKI